MKWSTFSYNYCWSSYVFLFDGWIAKCAMAVPIVGYLILFNDGVSQHLSFDRLANENAAIFGISAIARLKLIYFGLIFLGSANILYRLRRPFVFKLGRNRFQYVENALEHFTVATYIDIHGTIKTEGHYTPHGNYYDSEFDAFLELALGKEGIAGRRDQSTANWAAAKGQHEGLLRSTLIENFVRNDVKRRIALTVCIVISIFGYFFLLIPSADLFHKVVAVTLR